MVQKNHMPEAKQTIPNYPSPTTNLKTQFPIISFMDIPEFKRDDSLDYVKVLRALLEIPFPVGRNLLLDFLEGNRLNKSVIKHDLDEMGNFGALKIVSRNKINEFIDNLSKNKLIELTQTAGAAFMRVYKITESGISEILSPTLADKKTENKLNTYDTRITDEDREQFSELSGFLGKYNEGQKKAIISSKKNILCIAGAGSGKTTVLTKRVEFLVKFKGVKPEGVLAITFTRKAREEMQKRLEVLGIGGVHVETFNSFCEKILRRYGSKFYGRSVKLMNYRDKIFAAKEALKKLDIEMKDAIEMYFSPAQMRNKSTERLANMFMNDCFSVLDYFKIKKGGLVDFRKESDSSSMTALNLVYGVCKNIDSYMTRMGLRDYTDQIVDALRFFRENPREVPFYSHILVDEYQDVNSIQIDLLDLLLPQNLFCVGDPRQAIFGWRGSDINYILDLKKKFFDCEIVSLVKNYRSNSHIVNFMNKSIAPLGMPNLEHSFEGEKKLEVKDFIDAQGEQAFILDKILSMEDVPREEIFVLARTNKQLENLAISMRKVGIDFVIKDEFSPDVSNAGKVVLSTIHAIKGLEAECVFVMGCNSINFPCKISDHPIIEMIKLVDYDKLEEERRVFYVAVSRAKERLYLTYTGKKSYFINE